MDDATLQIEKITGIAEKNVACGVFVGRITLGDGTLGTLVSCILAEGESDDIGELLRDIFELSTKKLENSQSGSLKAIKVARDACRQYVQDKQKDFKVSFAWAFFYQSACYIVRHGDKVKIFVFEPPKSTEIKFEEGSGLLKPGQIYLIATEKFLPIFDSSIFSKEQEAFDPQEIIDGLATEISARDNQSEIGAALVLVKSEKIEETKETEGTGRIMNTEETEKVEQLNDSEVKEVEVERPKRRIPSPVPFVFGVFKRVFLEIKSLKRGDIKALFRLRRNIAAVATIIILILVVSVIFTIRQKQQRATIAEFNSHLSQATSQYNEAQALLELNKSRAREILIDADREIKSALGLIKSDERAQKLESDIANALRETEVTSNVNFETFTALPQTINSLSFNGNEVVAITSNKVIEINPSDKSKDETNGPSDSQSGFVFDNKGFISTGDKIWRVNLLDGKSETIIEGQTGHDIAVFIGNVYLIGNDQVVKFSPIENGYADGINYLDEKTNLDSSSRFAIDGNVWITNGQKILKFLRGEDQNFEIQGLTAQIGQLGAIYTSASIDNLYVIDKANSALLVIDKDGLYQKAYQSPEFGRASDLVVNDDESKVYLAVGDKILEAEL